MTVDANGEENVRPRCFFDINLGGINAVAEQLKSQSNIKHERRITFELYNDVVPKTVENFRALCTGELGNGKTTKKLLHYKGVIFHRVVKDFMIQSGDFSAGNGTGGESIYGGTFEDESLELKHDKPFLLSMANRGKNTNGSQFFITTQPAPHLDNIHVIFGQVVSGYDLVRQLEQLPVDRNSRPLQDAVIHNCGELVRQIKVKKDKKKKKQMVSSDEDVSKSDDSGAEQKLKEDKKKKKERKKSKDEETEDIDKINSEEAEEGELRHPMVSITKIDPDEIPEVSNKFLMRGDDNERKKDDIKRNRSSERNDSRNNRRRRSRDYSPRGQRDNRNSFGWSKKRMPTSRSGRAIKGRGVFRYRTPSRSRTRSQTPPHWKQAQKRTIKLSDLEKLEEDRQMREQEIKRREADRKKRHQELAKDIKKSFYELSHSTDYDKRKDSVDRELEKKEEELFSKEAGKNKKDIEARKSVDLNALDYEDNANSENDDPETENHQQPDKEHDNAVSREKRRRSKERRSKSKSLGDRKPRARSPYDSRRERYDRFANNRRSNFRSPRQSNFNNRGRFVDRRRRPRSRSNDRYRKRSPIRRSRDRKSRTPDKRRKRSRSQSSRPKSPKRSKSPRRSRSNRRDASSPPKTEGSPTQDKDKLAKEKMLKRAEALQLFKDHMRKEIAREEEKRAEKQRMDELEKERARKEIEELEKLKQETLQKLEEHEKLKQLTAVKKVLEAVAVTVHKSKKHQSGSSERDDVPAKKKKRSDRHHKKSKKRSKSSDFSD